MLRSLWSCWPIVADRRIPRWIEDRTRDTWNRACSFSPWNLHRPDLFCLCKKKKTKNISIKWISIFNSRKRLKKILHQTIGGSFYYKTITTNSVFLNFLRLINNLLLYRIWLAVVHATRKYNCERVVTTLGIHSPMHTRLSNIALYNTKSQF